MATQRKLNFDRRRLASGILCTLGILVSRRTLFAAASLPDVKKSGLSSGDSYLLAGGRTGGGYGGANASNFLGFYKLRDNSPAFVPVKTDIHSIVVRPDNGNEFLTISKNLPESTFFPNIFDLREQRLIRANKSGVFSGHAAFSPDGKVLVTSETDSAMQTGRLSVRDPLTHRVIDSIDSGGIFPHELKFIDSGRVLVANGGSPQQKGANLAEIDLVSGKVLSLRLSPDHGPGMRHFTIDSQGNLVIWTWITYTNADSSLPFAQILTGRGGESRRLDVVELGPEFSRHALRQPNQFLSVALHQATNQAVLSASGSSVVVVVDSQKGQVRKVLVKQNPTGIAACDDPNLIAISDSTGHLQFLDMYSLSWRTEREVAQSFLVGSHMQYLKVG